MSCLRTFKLANVVIKIFLGSHVNNINDFHKYVTCLVGYDVMCYPFILLTILFFRSTIKYKGYKLFCLFFKGDFVWLQGPSLEKSSEEIPPILLSHRLLPHDLVIEQLKKKIH
jgi:hypothetical protein